VSLKQKRNWYLHRYLKTGPRLTAKDLRNFSGHLTDSVAELLLHRNGGVPDDDTFRLDYEVTGTKTARVRTFFGLGCGEGTIANIDDIILRSWHDLPRGALPIGEIDVEGWDFDGLTLITFVQGELVNKICFFDNPHDCGPLDPDDPGRITVLAPSLASFMNRLKPNQAFQFREVFRLDDGADSIRRLSDAITATFDVDMERSNTRFDGGHVPSFYWPKHESSISFCYKNENKFWDPLPNDECDTDGHLLIAVTKERASAALRELKAKLKELEDWKKTKYVGRLDYSSRPYWRVNLDG
jgi:hypothetical protein